MHNSMILYMYVCTCMFVCMLTCACFVGCMGCGASVDKKKCDPTLPDNTAAAEDACLCCSTLKFHSRVFYFSRE